MAELRFHHAELKRPALGLLSVLALITALVWLSDSFRTSKQAQLERARAELNRARSGYRQALEAGDIIQTSHRRYQELQQRSFVGMEPRLLWIESLRNSGNVRKLYNLQYNLRRQREITLDDVEAGEHYQLYASPMQLHLEMAHEGDLVRFFASLDRERPAVYQLRSCSLVPVFDARGVALDSANVTADCELLWFTVRTPSDTAVDEEEET